MNGKKISELIDKIDDKYLAEYESDYQSSENKSYGTLAALISMGALIAAVIIGIVIKVNSLNTDNESVVAYENSSESSSEYFEASTDINDESTFEQETKEVSADIEFLKKMTGLDDIQAFFTIRYKDNKEGIFWIAEDEIYNHVGVYTDSGNNEHGRYGKNTDQQLHEYENKKTVVFYKYVEGEVDGVNCPVFEEYVIYDISWGEDGLSLGVRNNNIRYYEKYMEAIEDITAYPVIKNIQMIGDKEQISYCCPQVPYINQNYSSDRGLYFGYENYELYGLNIKNTFNKLIQLGAYSNIIAVINEDGTVDKYEVDTADREQLDSCVKKGYTAEFIINLLFPMYDEQSFDKESSIGKDISKLLADMTQKN